MSTGEGLPSLKFTKCHPNAKVPSRQHSFDAGLDMCAVGNTTLAPGTVRKVDLGLKVAIPEGYVGFMCSRSGLAAKHGIFILNAPGVIDAEYRGEMCAILKNGGNSTFEVKPGMRICQLVVTPVALLDLEEVESLEETARGEGGFGSTGV